MAYTIMGGLFVATFLTLLFLPALYALWFRKKLDQSVEGSANENRGQRGRIESRKPLTIAAE